MQCEDGPHLNVVVRNLAIALKVNPSENKVVIAFRDFGSGLELHLDVVDRGRCLDAQDDGLALGVPLAKLHENQHDCDTKLCIRGQKCLNQTEAAHMHASVRGSCLKSFRCEGVLSLALLLPGIVFCNPCIYVPVYLYGISLFVFAASFPLRCHGFDAPA